MSVRIGWLPHGRLGVTGDMTGELRLPPEEDDRLFQLAFSDGTLVRGGYGEGGACFFSVACEGAGLARVVGERSQVLELDWAVEWITIADVAGGLTATIEARDLPLFPELAAA